MFHNKAKHAICAPGRTARLAAHIFRKLASEVASRVLPLYPVKAYSKARF